MHRRSFLIRTTQFTFISLGIGLMEACGGSGSGYGGSSGTPPTQQGGSCDANGTIVTIQVVHTPNHTLTIPAADVVTGIGKTYTLADNGSGHTHDVTITAADFASLQGNNGVMELSSLSAGHTHNVTVNCA